MARFIVNPGGVVHSVNDEEFALHLGLASIKPSEANPAGSPAREATREEIAGWFRMQGLDVPAEYADEKPADKPAKSEK